MTNPRLNTTKRDVFGRKTNSLRQQGILPATIYGLNTPSQSVSVNQKELMELYEKVGETGLVDIVVDGEVVPALISKVDPHPVTGQAIHADLRRVNLKEKIVANVPVEIVGESPAQKSGLGTVVLLVSEVEVEALPANLPENFQIDATLLTEVGQEISLSSLVFDRNKITVKAEEDLVLARVEAPQDEPVEEVAPQEGAAQEGEATGEASQEKTSEEEKPQE